MIWSWNIWVENQDLDIWDIVEMSSATCFSVLDNWGNKKLKQVMSFPPNLIAVKETIDVLEEFYMTFLFKNNLVECI